MCLIIHKPKNKTIPADIIRRAMAVNPHGFGITYLDTGKTRKLFDYKGVERILNTERAIVAHFRFATIGTIDSNNIHPFSIDSRTVIYSNGTVDGYGTRTKSDIAHIADNVLSKLSPQDWRPFLELTDTRFAIVNLGSGSVTRIGEWHERGGVFYSKTNCFPQNTRVAVYGTLKSNYHNHGLIADQEFVGSGVTQTSFPLEVDGLPYLHDREGEGAGQVEVEIYDVSSEALQRLDRLEGHPTFYKRRVLPISMDDWSTTYAWVYFIQGRVLSDEADLTTCYGEHENPF